MEARDAIVSWLEQGDNFLRVTAAYPFSPRRGRAGLRDVAQTEGAALGELAAFVNRSLPRANWDAKHARQMLKHYLLEYRSTAEVAADPRFSLDERDALRGLKTVQDKLDNMCRHFQRLQRLHEHAGVRDMVTVRRSSALRRAQRQATHANQQQQQTAYVKLHFALTKAQRREREMDVVPESDLSNSCDNSEADKNATGERAVQSTVSGEEEKLEEEERRMELTAECAQVRIRGGKENNQNAGQEVVPSQSSQSVQREIRRSANKQQEQKKTQPQKKQGPTTKGKQGAVVPEPPVTALSSDEEDVDEALPTLRRSTRAKRQSPGKAVRPNQDGASPARKRARRESTAKKNDQVEMADVAPTQTTQGFNTSASDEPQGSLVNDENTPSLNTRSQQRRPFCKFATASKPSQPATKPLSSVTQPTEATVSGAPSHGTQPPQRPTSPPPTTSSSHDNTRKSTPGSAVPEAYRSAIAEVISQRRQLMSRMDNDSQASPAQEKRQRSLSESDYGLSDIDLPATDPTPRAARNNPGSSKSAGERSNRLESGPTAGLLPPLIAAVRSATTGKSNLERKRVFHRAKQLAFEQLKWHRENELQQYELELLRREMEAREAFALQELQLKRMRVRADTIQHMLSAGASIKEIAERLSLL